MKISNAPKVLSETAKKHIDSAVRKIYPKLQTIAGEDDDMEILLLEKTFVYLKNRVIKHSDKNPKLPIGFLHMFKFQILSERQKTLEQQMAKLSSINDFGKIHVPKMHKKQILNNSGKIGQIAVSKELTPSQQLIAKESKEQLFAFFDKISPERKYNKVSINMLKSRINGEGKTFTQLAAENNLSGAGNARMLTKIFLDKYGQIIKEILGQ